MWFLWLLLIGCFVALAIAFPWMWLAYLATGIFFTIGLVENSRRRHD